MPPGVLHKYIGKIAVRNLLLYLCLILSLFWLGLAQGLALISRMEVDVISASLGLYYFLWLSVSWEHAQMELPLACIVAEMLIWQLPTYKSKFQYSTFCVADNLHIEKLSWSSQLCGVGLLLLSSPFHNEETEAQRGSIISENFNTSRQIPEGVYTMLPQDSKFPESSENVLVLQWLLSWT